MIESVSESANDGDNNEKRGRRKYLTAAILVLFVVSVFIYTIVSKI